MKTQIIQLVKIQSSYIFDYIIDDTKIKIKEDMNYDIEMEKVILYQEDW